MDSPLTDPLPDDVLLRIHYNDRHRKIETWRIYHLDGRLRIYNGQFWRLETTLSKESLSRIRQIIAECALEQAKDMLPGEDTYDTAAYIWQWRDEQGQVHQLINRAYPAREHRATACAMDKLLDLEDLET